jgi:Ca2+-binding EF-hand superfamily protein
MFLEFDDNENGKINFEEFKAFLKKLFYKIRMSVKVVNDFG